VAAAPEMSLSTCSGPAADPAPAAARGIHSTHFAATDAAAPSPPEDEGDAGAGEDAEQRSRATRLPLLRSPGFAGSGSQLSAAFAAGRGRANEWRGRRWTAAAIGWDVRGAGGLRTSAYDSFFFLRSSRSAQPPRPCSRSGPAHPTRLPAPAPGRAQPPRLLLPRRAARNRRGRCGSLLRAGTAACDPTASAAVPSRPLRWVNGGARREVDPPT
jgi:hypothetical protein